jgi:hypothetical protein
MSFEGRCGIFCFTWLKILFSKRRWADSGSSGCLIYLSSVSSAFIFSAEDEKVFTDSLTLLFAVMSMNFVKLIASCKRVDTL